MTVYRESSSDLFYGDWMAQESRDALYAAERAGEMTCVRHDYRPDGHGGGVCAGCGDQLSRWEIS